MSNKYQKSINRRINIKKRMDSKTKIKKLLIISLLLIVILTLTNCSRPFYVPGASMGYFLWQTEDKEYHIRWSNDWVRNAPNDNLRKFSGSITTDGIIIIENLYLFEGEELTKDIENADIIKVKPSELEFTAYTTNHDFEDGIDFSIDNETYVEFDLKNNDIYDLGRISLGSFANSPDEEIFIISEDELLYEAKKPFYLKHPFSTFLYKLSYDRLFTNLYFFVMGVIIVEIIRISFLVKSRNYRKLSYISYGLLFLILIIVNIILLTR